MRNKIVLFSHVYHAFILNEIEYAAQVYKEVYLLCPENNELREKCKKYSNVEFIPFNMKINIINLLKSFRLMNIELALEIKRAFINKKFDKHYFYMIWANLYCEYVLLDFMKQITDKSDYIVLSLWFGQTAYATSRVKEKFSDVKAYSLAHSFEVDDKKNQYIDYVLKNKCHDNLDGIYFISSKVKEQYEKNHVIPNRWDISKDHVIYLGTVKRIDAISEQSQDSVFRIMSCSNCIAVKRIDLIIGALKLLDNYKIEWVHFGDGPLLNDLQKMVLNLGTNVTVKWMGKKDNYFIHNYIADNPVDVFINSSFSEGIPVSLMEAIAYGVPAIVTDVGGNSEIIFNDVNGFVIGENPSTNELADTIEKYHLLDSRKKEEMRLSAIDIFNKKFNAQILRKPFYEELKSDISR